MSHEEQISKAAVHLKCFRCSRGGSLGPDDWVLWEQLIVSLAQQAHTTAHQCPGWQFTAKSPGLPPGNGQLPEAWVCYFDSRTFTSSTVFTTEIALSKYLLSDEQMYACQLLGSSLESLLRFLVQDLYWLFQDVLWWLGVDLCSANVENQSLLRAILRHEDVQQALTRKFWLWTSCLSVPGSDHSSKKHLRQFSNMVRLMSSLSFHLWCKKNVAQDITLRLRPLELQRDIFWRQKGSLESLSKGSLLLQVLVKDYLEFVHYT